MTSPSITNTMKGPSKYNNSYEVSVSSCFTKNTYCSPNTSALDNLTNMSGLNASRRNSACVYVKCELCQKLFSKNSITFHRRRCQQDMNSSIDWSNSVYDSHFSSQNHESSSSIESARISRFTPPLTPQRESPLRDLWGDHYNTYYCLFLSSSPSSKKNYREEESRFQWHNCPKCGLQFQTNDELQDHLLAHNFEEWEETEVRTSPLVLRSGSNFSVSQNPIPQRFNQMNQLRRPSVHDVFNNDFPSQRALSLSKQLPTFQYCQTQVVVKNNSREDEAKKYDAEICVICLDDYTEKERLKRLPCLHLFHAQCVNRWFEKSNVCPCCKACIDEASLNS